MPAITHFYLLFCMVFCLPDFEIEVTIPFCRPTPPPETPGNSQESPSQSLMGTLLLSLGSWCTKDFVYALQESVSPIL